MPNGRNANRNFMSITRQEAKKANPFWETVSVVVQALLLAAILRSLFFQPFNIPSGSMKPTLLIGDYLFVSKWSYGYSRYSFPFGPDIFDGRIFADDAERGDVVVFKFPPDPSLDYIKRVIGLPGDRVQVIDSVVHINGEPIQREAVGTYEPDDPEDGRRPVPMYRETLPNGVSYLTLDFRKTVGDDTPVFEVPADQYFVMGDNRDNSADSRFDVGFVPAENLVGKAQVIFISMADGASAWQFWKWPSKLRASRLFDTL